MDALAKYFDITGESIFLIMLMVSVAVFVLTIGFFILGINSPLRRKVHKLTGHEDKGKEAFNSKIEGTLESLAPLAKPNNEKEVETMRHKLMHAGFHQNNSLAVFYSVKLFSALLGLLLASALYVWSPDWSQLNTAILLVVAMGIFLPDYLLSRKIKSRQSKIRAGVPDGLDLLVVCTESGLGFNASIQRVAKEISVSHPEFADELDTVCSKIQAGVELPKAFHELVVRTGIFELKGLVSMLSHASRIGGSLADSLRSYVEDYRDKRYQATEEIAAKIPAKMLFPTILFIWPCFFIVILGPAVIILSDSFK
ncbi:type II secretion system F family protein [Vibrio breoganii]